MVSFYSLIQFIGLPCCLIECRGQQPKRTHTQTHTHIKPTIQRTLMSPLLFDSTLVSAILLLILKPGLQCTCIHFYLNAFLFVCFSQKVKQKIGRHNTSHIALPNITLFSSIFLQKSSLPKHQYLCLLPPQSTTPSHRLCSAFLTFPFLSCFPPSCSLYPLMLYVQLLIESWLMFSNASEQSQCRLQLSRATACA